MIRFLVTVYFIVSRFISLKLFLRYGLSHQDWWDKPKKNRGIIMKNKIIVSRLRVVTDEGKQLIHEKVINTKYSTGNILQLSLVFDKEFDSLVLSTVLSTNERLPETRIDINDKFEIDFKDITDVVSKT